ncbi:MAG TPA: hypothetical protein VN873_15630 [Candidatus Angelobacter sp.]|nr:hypothetical protein [Candidatus Angelobacter sp.]
MKRTTFSLSLIALLLISCSQKQTSTPSERLAWHKNALVKGYENYGRQNPKWDKPAKEALEQFAEIRAGQGDLTAGASLVGYSAQEALKAGCDDPLIKYLYGRFASDYSTHPLSYWQDLFRQAADGLENSGYSPLLKFYANDRTANVVWEDRDQSKWQDVVKYRRAAMNDLAVALQDKSLPVDEVEAAGEALLDTIGQNDKETKDAYDGIQGPLFQNWPHTAAAYYLKARFYYRFAWQARGGGYANSVTEEGWKGFKENLAIADAAYRKAWSLNPKDVRIPTQMIEMTVSEQLDRKEMEQWFQRAMRLNTNNYDACSEKLRYLRPEWYGSRDDMLAFGRECAASTTWGGRVPLILVDAHYDCAVSLPQEDRAAYWKQPDVWPDIQSSYEKFFQLNPDVKDDYRYYYARYAFYCGQWQDFNKQVKLIRDADGTVNTAFFGGDEEFDKMMEQANAGGPKD